MLSCSLRCRKESKSRNQALKRQEEKPTSGPEKGIKTSDKISRRPVVGEKDRERKIRENKEWLARSRRTQTKGNWRREREEPRMKLAKRSVRMGPERERTVCLPLKVKGKLRTLAQGSTSSTLLVPVPESVIHRIRSSVPVRGKFLTSSLLLFSPIEVVVAGYACAGSCLLRPCNRE